MQGFGERMYKSEKAQMEKVISEDTLSLGVCYFKLYASSENVSDTDFVYMQMHPSI